MYVCVCVYLSITLYHSLSNYLFLTHIHTHSLSLIVLMNKCKLIVDLFSLWLQQR